MIVKRNNYPAGGFLLLILFMLIAFYSSVKGDSSKISKDTCEGTLFIQVEGETEEPGIYAFKRDARLSDILKRAGRGQRRCHRYI